MTELARIGDDALILPDRSLRAWADEMQAAAQIARAIVGTPFVPVSLHVKNGNSIDVTATTAVVAATLLAGRELGLEPMAALRSIDVIQGTPALRAVALRGLVMSHGAQIWVEESTSTRAIVQGIARGSDKIQQSIWSMDRAKDLGLANKPNWRSQPGVMLVARATAECARLIAPDAILGLPYVAEELGDPQRPRGRAVEQEAAPAARTARRASIPAPPPVVEATPEAPAEPDVEMISGAQLKALQAGFHDLDISDRAERLRVTGVIVSRAGITSAKDLTKDEASRVIDELQQRKLRARLDADAQAETIEAQLEVAYLADNGLEDVPLPGFDDPSPDN
jgi:hypothetical protein